MQYCYRNIGKITIFKGQQKLFWLLMVAIKFSPTVNNLKALCGLNKNGLITDDKEINFITCKVAIMIIFRFF